MARTHTKTAGTGTMNETLAHKHLIFHLRVLGKTNIGTVKTGSMKEDLMARLIKMSLCLIFTESNPTF